MTVTLDDIYNLGDYVFVAGSTQTFQFTTTQDGSVIDISGSECSCTICPLGQVDIVTITLTGTITDAAGGTFQCVLEGEDSVGLSGKYVLFPLCVDVDGVPHRDGVGILTVTPAPDVF